MKGRYENNNGNSISNYLINLMKEDKKVIFLIDTPGINWSKIRKSFLFIFEFLSDG